MMDALAALAPGGGITVALLQSTIEGGISLLTPLLQFADRHPELTGE